MKWAVKNVGLVTGAALILFGMACLEMRLESIEEKLDRTARIALELREVSAALPASAFGQVNP